MQGKTIAILESRARDQMADLVRKQGGVPFSAPALAEIPDVDPARLSASIRAWMEHPPDVFVFQTGVGTRALFAATDALGLTGDLMRRLDDATVVVRGPKPTAVLRGRKVRIDLAASDPFTTHEVLSELEAVALDGKRVVVQRYGDANSGLTSALEQRGAAVEEIVTYRWGLPEDIAPLRALIDALARDEIDLVAFTSASQVMNLFTVARDAGREDALRSGLNRTLVASIGPVCSDALRKYGVPIAIEAHPPKLGPFVTAIDAALTGSMRTAG
jgi:uroporphyrinogen-III synthase